MIAIKDKPNDNWGWPCVKGVKDWVCFENGERELLATHHVVITRGKYAGTSLSDLDDVWYLNFMKDKGVDNDEGFMVKCAKLRLSELS